MRVRNIAHVCFLNVGRLQTRMSDAKEASCVVGLGAFGVRGVGPADDVCSLYNPHVLGAKHAAGVWWSGA